VVVAALILISPIVAIGQITLNYEGSFALTNAAGWGDYYYSSLAFVPDGTTRPGWSGAAVSGPTVIARNSWGGKIREHGPVPTLSKTPGGVQICPWIQRASGGTELDGDQEVDCVDSNGDLWGLIQHSQTSDTGLFSDPGTATLGRLHTGDSLTIDFYSPSYSGGTNVANPDYQIDIGPAVAAGAGWHHADSKIQDIAVDWDTSRLYVLDAGVNGMPNPATRQARVHVFTVTGPTPSGTVVRIR